jgi:hypothetical protein
MPDTFSSFAQKLTQQYNLKPIDIYLLDLVPLIELIWADGERQESEIQILMSFVDEMLALFKMQELDDCISRDDIIEFIDRYIHVRPAPGLLAELRTMAIELANKRSDSSRNLDIISYCMDVAAASINSTALSDEKVSRIAKEEKTLLINIISALNISENQTVNLP